MSTPYDIYYHIPAEIEAEYPALWATIDKYFSDLTEEKKAMIASLVISTCAECHNANKNYCDC